MTTRDQFAIRAFGIGAIAVFYGFYVASAAIGELVGLPEWVVLLFILSLLVWLAVGLLNKAVGKEDRNEW